MAREYVIREGISFQLSSDAFSDGGLIPVKYTCDGSDVNPPLKWSGVPPGTKSLAMIVYDPDAPSGTFIHWILYNINPSVTSIAEGASRKDDREIPGIGVQGLNDFGEVGYGGPCPPRGHGTHRYYFALHALNVSSLNVKEPATASSLINAMKGKVLGYAILMGKYSRR